MPGRPSGDRIHGYLRPEAFSRRVERAANRAGSRAVATTMGSSVERRNIRAVVVAGRLRRPDPQRPQAAVVAAIHGCEVVASELALRLLEMACSAEPTGPVADLLEVADLAVVPCANPDGRARALASLEGEGWWQRAPRGNASGVDLNRNWPSPHGGARSRWRLPGGMRHLPWRRQPEPMSEPETRALDAFFAERRPFVLMNLHSPGRSITHPAEVPPDRGGDLDALRLTTSAFTANQTTWRYQPRPKRHPVANPGSPDGYVYDRYGTLPLMIEIGEPAAKLLKNPLRMRSAFWWSNPEDLEANLANDADACFAAMRAAIR